VKKPTNSGTDSSEEQSIGRPSKAETKRNLDEIFALSEILILQSSKSLAAVGFSELVVTAMAEANAMPLDGSRKRQTKYIAKQLREFNLARLRETAEALNAHKDAGVPIQIGGEIIDIPQNPLIAKFLEQGNNAIQEFCETYSAADRQHLRNLVRNVQKNQNSKRKDHFLNELSTYLDEIEN